MRHNITEGIYRIIKLVSVSVVSGCQPPCYCFRYVSSRFTCSLTYLQRCRGARWNLRICLNILFSSRSYKAAVGLYTTFAVTPPAMSLYKRKTSDDMRIISKTNIQPISIPYRGPQLDAIIQLQQSHWPRYSQMCFPCLCVCGMNATSISPIALYISPSAEFLHRRKQHFAVSSSAIALIWRFDRSGFKTMLS